MCTGGSNCKPADPLAFFDAQPILLRTKNCPQATNELEVSEHVIWEPIATVALSKSAIYIYWLWTANLFYVYIYSIYHFSSILDYCFFKIL
jgi:hypothetical protein